ncbi:GntR family transcriptional regulator [soil metagenome]
MLIVVEKESGIPIYRQIVDQIRFQVDSGLLCPGDQLPSTRALSQELGVNPMTVSKSFGLLEGEGLVVRRPGLQLVIAERSADDEQRGREAQLTALLEPVATAARQLGIGTEHAVLILREVMARPTTQEAKQK